MVGVITIDDVLQIRPDWGPAEAARFLNQNEEALGEATRMRLHRIARIVPPPEFQA